MKFSFKRRTAMMGPRNPRWNGGKSEYPDHSLLKRIRKTVLKKTNSKCEHCGNPAVVVHHKDGSKKNHSLNNLIPLCNSCHWKLHGGPRDSYILKRIKLNAFSFLKSFQKINSTNLLTGKELVNVFKIHLASLRNLRKRGELPFVKIGRRIFFRREDIEHIISENTYPPKQNGSK